MEACPVEIDSIWCIYIWTRLPLNGQFILLVFVVKMVHTFGEEKYSSKKIFLYMAEISSIPGPALPQIFAKISPLQYVSLEARFHFALFFWAAKIKYYEQDLAFP